MVKILKKHIKALAPLRPSIQLEPGEYAVVRWRQPDTQGTTVCVVRLFRGKLKAVPMAVPLRLKDVDTAQQSYMYRVDNTLTDTVDYYLTKLAPKWGMTKAAQRWLERASLSAS